MTDYFLNSGSNECVGTAGGDTVGVVIPNLSRDIRRAMGISYAAVGALGARVGAGAQLIAMDEAVKNTNARLISVYMPRDTKGGGGHGCLILVGADDTSDARRAVEMGLELTDRYLGGIYVCEAGHMEMHYSARAGEVLSSAFGAPQGSAFGMVCACPGAVGMVTADTAIKAAAVDVLKIATPDFGTAHTNEIMAFVSGEAAAVKTSVDAGRAAGMTLLGKMCENAPRPLAEPYF